MAGGGGRLAGVADERAAQTAMAEGVIDGEGSQQQGRRGPGGHRPQPRATHQCALRPRHAGQIDEVRAALAQALGGLGEAPRSEGAADQGLDGDGVGRELAADGRRRCRVGGR